MKKLIALLEAASGLPKTALAACVNADGSFNEEEFGKTESKIREGIEAKLNKAREEATTEAEKAAGEKGTFDDGFKKGEAKAHDRNEKRLRELFGVEEKLGGEDLLKAIAANKDKAPKEITKDVVERQPWYQELMEAKEKAHKEEIAKVKGEHETFKKDVDRKDRISKMRERATPLIEELNLNLSKDPQRRAAQLANIFEKLEANDYDIQGDRILVLKEGKVMKDALDNSIVFKDHITSVATSLYDPLESKERDSAGAKNDNKDANKQKAAWTKDMPKTDEEYQAILANDDIPIAERQALMDARRA